MNLRILTTGLTMALAVFAVGLSSVGAQEPTIRTKRLVSNPASPNYSYQQGPRTRIFVTKRHWLDAGTEVRPGERKYTDYAIPPNYTHTMIDQVTGRPWMRQPLVDPWDMPGAPKGGYGY
jgi:hypothetical protein